MQRGTLLSLSPSFNRFSSGRLEEIAARVIAESEDFISEGEIGMTKSEDFISDYKTEEDSPLDSVNEHENLEQVQEDDDEEEEDFEFAVVGRDPKASPITADEIFSNGQIRPVFPIFNRDLLFSGEDDGDSKSANDSANNLSLRKLLIDEREIPSSSSSEADELEGVPEGTYCVWTPKSPQASPEICKKSSSTGSSSSKRWKFRDFLNRSNSDGKDAYIFLAPTASSKTKKDEKSEKREKAEIPKERKNSSSGESKIIENMKLKRISREKVSAHEIHYVRNRALKEVDKRRSYLPYRQDLVGFFGNVNGLSRNIHSPF